MTPLASVQYTERLTVVAELVVATDTVSVDVVMEVTVSARKVRARRRADGDESPLSLATSPACLPLVT